MINDKENTYYYYYYFKFAGGELTIDIVPISKSNKSATRYFWGRFKNKTNYTRLDKYKESAADMN